MTFFLFCKSWRNDVLRAKRLIESVITFNSDCLPFYLSIPRDDLKLFEQYLCFTELRSRAKFPISVVFDEDIVRSIPKSTELDYRNLDGYAHQQVIKSQAWRWVGSDNFLCLDSDSYFTKEFKQSNFIHPSGVPYSLLHESTALLSDAKLMGKFKVIEDYQSESNQLKNLFGRRGPNYDFGPVPVIWSGRVWDDLDRLFWKQRGWRIWEAIIAYPAEIRWYGEALLKFQSIPLYPIDPLFNVYHYDWQIRAERMRIKKGIPLNHQIYIGECKQSNWERDLDPPFAKKNIVSRVWRKIKSRYF